MKNTRSLFVFALLLITSISSAQVYNMGSSSGTINLSKADYTNNTNKRWNINVNRAVNLKLTYTVNTETTYDAVYIYNQDNNGNLILKTALIVMLPF